MGKDCSTIRSAYSDTPCFSGKVTRCLDDCTWDRTECGFCGNDEVEGAERIWTSSERAGLQRRAEWCDGEQFDRDELIMESPEVCRDLGAVGSVACGADCRDFEERGGLRAASPGAVRVRRPTGRGRCCHESSAPDASEQCWPRLLPNDADPDDVTGGATCK